ncbi:M42 family peptidase [uncultured Vagococcus sp.]|uniref:M42 family peptidase n=1 Tax=uncultured Vagococcus sp. TaxID=189676 RepID=UPI002583D618|nr:M42 family peptidase [uncultured Vagococcus sp.]
MKTDTLSLLNKLTETTAISGNEKNVSQLLKQELVSITDDIVYDNLGSIFGIKKSQTENAPVVMVSGYIDESGFVVKELLTNGTIKCLAIGIHKKDSLLGSKIQVITANNKTIPGVIVPTNSAGEILNDKNEVVIQCGFLTKEEIINAGIDYGDSVTYATDSFLSANNTHYFGKAIGRSYGALQVIHLLTELKDIELPFDLYAGGTVLNQVGNRGAQTATNLVQPDLAITFDTLEANTDITKNEKQGILGDGLLLTYYDRSILPNRKLTTDFKNSCIEKNISFQNYYSLTSSDAGWIHKLRIGSPTLMLNIPASNLNASTSIINLADLENALQASLHFISNLSNEDILSFKQENR